MDADLRDLHARLVRLYEALREDTRGRFDRMNPFSEDLFSWKERGDYRFGSGRNITVFNSVTVVGKVEVGDNTWIGPFTSLDGSGGLAIGRYCCISSACHFMTHDTSRNALTGGRAPYEYAPITVGDNCYFGVGAVVVKGVKIGDRCVIGAGAVVTRDLPAGSIAVGVPARVVGQVVVDGEQVRYRYDDPPAA